MTETVGVRIEKVIFSGPATIVFWDDGMKTVVKCSEDDTFSYEVGIAMCTLKRIFGRSFREYQRHVKKLVNESGKEKGEDHGKKN